jgi:type III secretory pathway component EscS
MNNSSCIYKSILIWGLGFSSLHCLWILLVVAGWAQSVIDFIFKIHMMNSPIQVQPFSLIFSIQLLLITFLIGMTYGVFIYYMKRFSS